MNSSVKVLFYQVEVFLSHRLRSLSLPSPGRLLSGKFTARLRKGKRSKAKQSEVTQLCPTFFDPMDCSLPGSSVHGILQVRILEWVAISFSRGFYRPRNRMQVSCIAGKRFTTWTTREALKRKSYTLKTIWWGFPHQIVQGLRLHPSNAEGTGSIPGWSGSSISGCIPERTEIRDSNR